MTEEYKQALVDSIKAQRQLDDSAEFAKELNGLVKEGISDPLSSEREGCAWLFLYPPLPPRVFSHSEDHRRRPDCGLEPTV